ncbi:hypothetical protein MMC30_001890 [Trapelia coarctata]|nr:hypothetical protein [Trapelia coarctata]
MLAGGCLLTAGGGVVAWTNTLAGIPFALAGAVVSLSSIKDLHDAKFFQPPAPRGPAGPAGPEGPANNVRRRGRLVRRKDDKKKKPEDKRKGLEAGGDAGHSGDESDGGIEMEGDDGGGDGGE